MVKKRGLVPEGEEGDENPEFQETHQRNKPSKFRISTWCLLKGQWLTENSVLLENRLRDMVREQAEAAVQHHFESTPRSLNEAELSIFRRYKLGFVGQLPRKLYTRNIIEAEGSSPLKVELIDTQTRNVVTDGPLSSAKVEIVVLHGQFKDALPEDWTQKYFNDNIVLKRRDKGPLLVGECLIALCKGIGFVKGISFTDNSSWVRSQKFRLGAKIPLKMAKEDLVREAVSSPFKVIHHRGDTAEKRSTPSLEDEVWILDGILKDGKLHKRLAEHQIYKVKDLMQQYHEDRSSLHKILGRSKVRKVIVQMAKTYFPRNECTNLSNWAPGIIHPDPISQSTVPFSAAASSQGQPEVPMPYNEGMETGHRVDQSMALNLDTAIADSLMIDELFAEPSGYSQDILNVLTSNWSSIPQPTLEEGYGSFVGATTTSASPMGILSSFPNLGASTSGTVKPKRLWRKIRTVLRMLIKGDAVALRRAKFPCMS